MVNDGFRSLERAELTQRSRARRGRRAAALLVGFLLPAVAGGDGPRVPAPPSSDISFTGFTVPSRKATLVSLQVARITRFEVAEGQEVSCGELLLSLDDAVQRARTEAARIEARCTLRFEVELARVRMQRAAEERERLDHLDGNAMTSIKEYRDALAAAETTRLEHELAQARLGQAEQRYVVQERLLEQLRIRAPFDAYVAERLKEEGETAEEREGLITIAQLDPLLVTVDVPLTQASRIRPGSEVPIRSVDPQWPARTGKVVFASRVADAGSQMFRVKLRVSNKDGGWIAGMKVVVDFGRSAELASPPAAALRAARRTP